MDVDEDSKRQRGCLKGVLRICDKHQNDMCLSTLPPMAVVALRSLGGGSIVGIYNVIAGTYYVCVVVSLFCMCAVTQAIGCHLCLCHFYIDIHCLLYISRTRIIQLAQTNTTKSLMMSISYMYMYISYGITDLNRFKCKTLN